MKKIKIMAKLKFLVFLVIVLILIVGVFRTSFALLSGSLIEKIKFNEKTSGYISFNYVDSKEHVFEVNNPKKRNDFFGERMSGDNCFDFNISISERDLVKQNVAYEILFMNLDNAIDSDFVKFYLTDQNNLPVLGYENGAQKFSSFESDIEGKIIYKGSFSKNSLQNKFRLRIWVSDAYEKDIKSILAYHVKVRIDKEKV